jgi:hypothetical protein
MGPMRIVTPRQPQSALPLYSSRSERPTPWLARRRRSGLALLGFRAAAAATVLSTTVLVATVLFATVLPVPAVAATSTVPSSVTSSGALSTPSAEQLAGRTQGCTLQERGALTDYSRKIAAAQDVDAARGLASRPAGLARRALGVATWVAPQTESLGAAKERLQAFENRLAMASTPAAVAEEFDVLVGAADARVEPVGGADPMQLADLTIDNAEVHGPAGCHYSTGEVIAVIFGFLLFIIPGIILLVVLC